MLCCITGLLIVSCDGRVNDNKIETMADLISRYGNPDRVIQSHDVGMDVPCKYVVKIRYNKISTDYFVDENAKVVFTLENVPY